MREKVVEKKLVAPTATTLNRAVLLDTPLEARRAKLVTYLQGEITAVTGLKLALEDLNKPMQAFGLDSLMVMQFRNRVEQSLGIAVSLVDFLKGLTLGQVVEKTLTELAGAKAINHPVSRLEIERFQRLNSGAVETLSEAEMDSLLGSLLEDA